MVSLFLREMQSFLLPDKKYVVPINGTEVMLVKIGQLPTRRVTVTWNTFLQFVSPRAEKEVNAKVEEEAAGEDGYEGEEDGSGPRSDVGATAAL